MKWIQKTKTVDVNGIKVVMSQSQPITNYILLIIVSLATVGCVVGAILLPAFGVTFLVMGSGFGLISFAVLRAITTVII